MNRQIEKSLLDIGNQLNNAELISTSFVLSKLKKYSSEYPEDKTIGSLKIVFANLEKNNKAFITRKDFKNLYKNHFTSKTAFASLFENELGEKEIIKEASKPQELKPVDLSQYKADKFITKLVGSVIKESKETINHNLVKQAEDKLFKDLNFLDFRAKSVKVIDSTKNILLALASFETPRGYTEIYIPLTKDLKSTVFIGNNIVQDLNKEAIANYIVNNSGQRLKTASKQIINGLESYFTPKESKTELAITSLKLSKANSSFGLDNSILAYTLPENKETIVELPKSNEFNSLEDKFASPMGIALETFGEKVLHKAASVLESTLNQANSPPLKIKLASSSKDSLMFSVLSKSGKAFTVPVKVAGGFNPLSPEYALVNGYVRKIDASFEASLDEESFDKKSFANTANLSLMTGDQLISLGKSLVASKDFVKLESVLDAIREKDENLYKNAYKLILEEGISKQASKITKCSKLIKSPNSIYKVCAHTGLPENRVYQDAHGNCRAFHTNDIVPEKGFFSTAKILGV
jgi:hypothetical protein